MYIVAIGWIYVVLMMSITETSITAGVMTFVLYGILPLGVILYLLGTPERRRRREELEKKQNSEAIEHEAWFHRQVQTGLDAANAGDVMSAEEVEAEAAAWRVETQRKMIGTDS